MSRVLDTLTRHMAFEQLEELRKCFALEKSLANTPLPPTYDEADELFRMWLMDLHDQYHARISSETKQAYLTAVEIETSSPVQVVCERCNGDGMDPEGYLSMTGERMYCPRCGGSGEHLAEQ